MSAAYCQQPLKNAVGVPFIVQPLPLCLPWARKMTMFYLLLQGKKESAIMGVRYVEDDICEEEFNLGRNEMKNV